MVRIGSGGEVIHDHSRTEGARPSEPRTTSNGNGTYTQSNPSSNQIHTLPPPLANPYEAQGGTSFCARPVPCCGRMMPLWQTLLVFLLVSVVISIVLSVLPYWVTIVFYVAFFAYIAYICCKQPVMVNQPERPIGGAREEPARRPRPTAFSGRPGSVA